MRCSARDSFRMRAQPSRVQHKLGSSCCTLRGCAYNITLPKNPPKYPTPPYDAPPLGRHALPAARRLLLEHCACPVAAHGAVLAARGTGRRFRLAQCLCEVAQRQCPVSLLHCEARASQRLPQARVLRDCCGVGVAHHCSECCRCACLHCNGKLRNGMSQDCCGIQKLSALRSFSDFVAAISYSSVSSDVLSDFLLPLCNGRCRRVRPGYGR